jgi:hypothetical protein
LSKAAGSRIIFGSDPEPIGGADWLEIVGQILLSNNSSDFIELGTIPVTFRILKIGM